MVVGSVRAVHVGEGRGSCRSESNLYLESIGNGVYYLLLFLYFYLLLDLSFDH